MPSSPILSSAPRPRTHSGSHVPRRQFSAVSRRRRRQPLLRRRRLPAAVRRCAAERRPLCVRVPGVSNVPEAVSVLPTLYERGVGDAIDGSKEGVPADLGADGDFEDIRNHYVRQLFGVPADDTQRGKRERYLALGRVATGEAMLRTFAEWRRPGLTCRGGLVWFARDLSPGAGWGIIDAGGRPEVRLLVPQARVVAGYARRDRRGAERPLAARAERHANTGRRRAAGRPLSRRHDARSPGTQDASHSWRQFDLHPCRRDVRRFPRSDPRLSFRRTGARCRGRHAARSGNGNSARLLLLLPRNAARDVLD